MDSVIQAARLLSGMYNGSNTLYKDHGEDVYILALTQSDHTTNDFNRICNMLAFLEEHCEILVSADAVQKLAVI